MLLCFWKFIFKVTFCEGQIKQWEQWAAIDYWVNLLIRCALMMTTFFNIILLAEKLLISETILMDKGL